jgi:hypothetical protein
MLFFFRLPSSVFGLLSFVFYLLSFIFLFPEPYALSFFLK